MPGDLEIKGLEALKLKYKEFNEELAKSVEHLSNTIKIAEKMDAATLKQVRTLTALNDEERKATKAAEASALAKQRLEKATIQTTSTQLRYEQQLKKTTEAKKKGTDATNAWGKAIDSFQFKFNALGNLMAGFALSAIGGVVGALKTVIGWNDEYKKALNSLGAITGLRGQDLKDLAKEAKATGQAFNMSGKDVLTAYEKVGSLLPELLKNKEALSEVTKQAILLSQASGGRLGLEETTKAVGAVMNQFNLTAGESSRIVNVLAAAEVEGSASTQDLTESLKNVGAVANGAGITFEQTSALLEVLAKKQILGTEAGTKLRGAILKLQDAGIGYKSGVFNINDALKEMQAQLSSKTTAQEKDALSLKVFGIENKTAGTILLENIGLYEEMTGKITGTNTALDQAQIQLDSASTEWKKFGLSIQDALTSDTFETINKGLAKFVRGTVSILGGLSGVIIDTVRLIGEGVYRILDVGAIASGNYLSNIEKFYKGFQERMAGNFKNITNPLAEQTAEIKANTDIQTKIVSKAADDYVAIDKEKEAKLKKEREKAAKELIEQSAKLENEKRKTLLKWNQDEYSESIKIDDDNQKMMNEGVQNFYDERNRIIQEQYALAIENAYTNDEAIKEAEYAQKMALLDSEEIFWQDKLLLAVKGSAEENAALNGLNAIKVQKAKETSAQLMDIAKLQSDIEKKTLDAKRENKQIELQLENAFVDGIGRVFGRESAIYKVFFGLMKAAEIARVWVKTAAANAEITAATTAAAATAAVTVVGLPLVPGIIATGAAAVSANTTSAILNTALIAGQSVLEITGYEKGTKDHKGGSVIMGEGKGMYAGHELVTLPDGTKFLTPDHATFYPNLPEHSVVTAAPFVNEELRKSFENTQLSKNDNKFMSDAILRDMNKNLKMLTKKNTAVHIHGMNVGFIDMVNKRYRS